MSFATNEGWTGYSLTLVFHTTPDGLADFVASSRLPAPAPIEDPPPAGQPLAAGTPMCGLDDGFTYTVIVRSDRTFPDLWRSLAVDSTTSDAPRVLVVATVL